MNGRLSFLPGEILLPGIPVVTTNSKKSAEVISSENAAKDRTVSILGKIGGCSMQNAEKKRTVACYRRRSLKQKNT